MNNKQKLSIVIPVYNEEASIEEIIKRLELVNIPLEKEIIIVDDGSTDKTRNILKNLKSDNKIVLRDINGGKGDALKKGFLVSSGDIIIIQDADLEYNPKDYFCLIKPILDNTACVVYGSRMLKKENRKNFYFRSYFANKVLTKISNVFTGLHLTDMETCYKVFTKEVLDSFKSDLCSKRFGVEPEITAKIAKKGWRVCEVPISYNGRSYKKGKKVGWKDGLAGVWHILRFNLLQ